jgi:hypothetical protein
MRAGRSGQLMGSILNPLENAEMQEGTIQGKTLLMLLCRRQNSDDGDPETLLPLISLTPTSAQSFAIKIKPPN